MEKVVPLLYDLAAVFLVIACVRTCARRGFVRTFISLVGFVIALILARAISNFAGEYIFSNFVQQKLTEEISGQILSTGSVEQFARAVRQAFDQIPQFLRDTLQLAGLDEGSFVFSAGGIEDLAGKIVEETMGPLCIAFISTLLFLVLFWLFSFVIRLLSRSFGHLRQIPLIGPLNAFLGGLVGVAEAFIYLKLIVSLISLILTFTGDRIPFFNRQIIEDTWILRLFFERDSLGTILSPQK